MDPQLGLKGNLPLSEGALTEMKTSTQIICIGHSNSPLKQRKENSRNPAGAQFAIGKKRLGFCQLCSPCCKLSLRQKKMLWGGTIFLHHQQ